MKENTELILIECTQETANALSLKIEGLPGTQCRVTERKNLSGSEATWIVVATLASQSLPHLLTFISSRRPKLPTKIKVGDIEIENPTREDLERLRNMYTKFAEPEKKDD